MQLYKQQEEEKEEVSIFGDLSKPVWAQKKVAWFKKDAEEKELAIVRQKQLEEQR